MLPGLPVTQFPHLRRGRLSSLSAAAGVGAVLGSLMAKAPPKPCPGSHDAPVRVEPRPRAQHSSQLCLLCHHTSTHLTQRHFQEPWLFALGMTSLCFAVYLLLFRRVYSCP